MKFPVCRLNRSKIGFRRAKSPGQFTDIMTRTAYTLNFRTAATDTGEFGKPSNDTHANQLLIVGNGRGSTAPVHALRRLRSNLNPNLVAHLTFQCRRITGGACARQGIGLILQHPAATIKPPFFQKDSERISERGLHNTCSCVALFPGGIFRRSRSHTRIGLNTN